MITFKQQFDKLTEAYIRNEVNPYDSCACFIGNLLNNNDGWADALACGTARAVYKPAEIANAIRNENMLISVIKNEAEGFYSPLDIVRLEKNFMDFFWGRPRCIEPEELLFMAFDSTLDMLKQIHESKGEIVEPFEFKQRQLLTA